MICSLELRIFIADAFVYFISKGIILYPHICCSPYPKVCFEKGSNFKI